MQTVLIVDVLYPKVACTTEMTWKLWQSKEKKVLKYLQFVLSMTDNDTDLIWKCNLKFRKFILLTFSLRFVFIAFAVNGVLFERVCVGADVLLVLSSRGEAGISDQLASVHRVISDGRWEDDMNLSPSLLFSKKQNKTLISNHCFQTIKQQVYWQRHQAAGCGDCANKEISGWLL